MMPSPPHLIISHEHNNYRRICEFETLSPLSTQELSPQALLSSSLLPARRHSSCSWTQPIGHLACARMDSKQAPDCRSGRSRASARTARLPPPLSLTPAPRAAPGSSWTGQQTRQTHPGHRPGRLRANARLARLPAAFQPQSRAPHRLLALRRSCPARMNQLLELSHGTDSSDVSTTDCDIAPPPTYPGSARKRMRKEGRTFGYDSSSLARGLAPGPFKWLAARQNINRQPLGEK